MVEAGYDPEVAFYEAVNESKLTTDLIYKYGLAGMFDRISNTAAYGAMTIGPQIIDESVKDKIRHGQWKTLKTAVSIEDWRRDYQEAYPEYKKLLDRDCRTSGRCGGQPGSQTAWSAQIGASFQSPIL